MSDSPQTPQPVIMMVVGFLGGISMILAAGLVYLAASRGQHDPVIVTALVSLASAALGGLAALLVTTRTTNPLPMPAPPEPVQPAPVEPAPVVPAVPVAAPEAAPATSTL